MKFYCLLLLLLLLAPSLSATPFGAAQLAKIGDFALLDHQGKFHQLSWYNDQKAVVIFIQGNGCPITRNGALTLETIRDDFAGQGVNFFMLNPQPQDDRDSIADEAAEFNYDFPILIDESQLVAESLGVDRKYRTNKRAVVSKSRHE